MVKPLQAVKDWAAKNAGFTGLVIVVREEARGKGGRLRKKILRLYLAQEGKALKQKVDYKTDQPLPGWNQYETFACGPRENGECECCHRFYSGLDLMRVRVARIEPERRGLIAYGSVCGDCRRQFQFPIATPIRKFTLELPAL